MRTDALALLTCVALASCSTSPPSMKNIIAIESNSPNFTAEQVEQVIAIPLERALSEIEDAKMVRSSSTSGGSCRIEVEFENTPSEQARHQVEGVVRATWKKLNLSSPGPRVSVEARRLP